MSRVILVTRNFPPLRGGMERLNFRLYEELRREYEVFLIGPSGAESYCPDATKVWSSPPLPVWRFLNASFWKTLFLCIRYLPGLIIAGSGVAALPAVLAGRLTGTPILTYLHGLDIISPHPIYRHVFLPVIRRSTAWLTNSGYTRQAAIGAGIQPEKIRILHPGTDLPELSGAVGGENFRARIQAGNRPILLSVGRLTRRKGLLEFIELALPEIVRQCPEVLLVVIGPEPIHSVQGLREPVAAMLSERAAQCGLQANLRILGDVDDQLLAGAYQASQVHVFPVLDLPGDVEGFGMVAVEAASYGVPTVAFAVGGVPDAVDPARSGWLLESGNYTAMAEIVIQYLRHPEWISEVQANCWRHSQRFAWSQFGDRLRPIVGEFLTVNKPSHIST